MSTRNISLNTVITILFFIGVDVYAYFALNKTTHKYKFKKVFRVVFFIAVAMGYVGLYLLYFNFKNKPLNSSLIPNLLIGFFFSFFAFKLVLIVFFLLEDITRILTILYAVFRNLVSPKKEKILIPSRRNFIRQSALTIASVPFASMLYGITKGKYNFKINKLNIDSKNLPKSFDGFRIVQISDIHSGSFDSRDAIKEGIDLINQQNADVILFTGDLVNNDSREVEPFIDDFKKLKSKNGVYSVLGNHDYGDYKKWNSDKEKEDNMQLLYQYQKQMNFTLLNNQNAIISKQGEKIGIIGVENWGNAPFPQRGDLDKAILGLEDVPFKILMSHDPTHWNKKVIPHKSHFDLTLSGHTHGMQFGIEVPGFKWSPSQYIYPEWADLYEKSGQYLYVNRGFGFLGFPGRAGIRPEITVIELKNIS